MVSRSELAPLIQSFVVIAFVALYGRSDLLHGVAEVLQSVSLATGHKGRI